MLPLLVNSCSYDDQPIKDRMDDFDKRLSDLEARVANINSNIGSLGTAIDALKSGDQIVSVDPLPDGSGWNIKFSKSGEIKIYNGKDGQAGTNGENGTTPQIGVNLDDDGIYYWTVNGEYLRDESGNKIPATSRMETPQIKIEGGKFMLSYDGINWMPIGDAGNTDPNVVVFLSVIDGEDTVTFILADGRQIEIPKVQSFALNIPKVNYVTTAGGVIQINYSVTSADDKTVVNGFATNGYTVVFDSVTESIGSISITAPDPIVDGQVFAFAINKSGVTSGRIISICEGMIMVDDSMVPELVPTEGGIVFIPVMTNQDFRVIIPNDAKSWISLIEEDTKASIRQEFVQLKVEANTAAPRSAEIKVLDEGGSTVSVITIAQDGEGSTPGNTDYTNPINDWERDGTLTF